LTNHSYHSTLVNSTRLDWKTGCGPRPGAVTLSPAEVGALKQFAININDSNRWVFIILARKGKQTGQTGQNRAKPAKLPYCHGPYDDVTPPDGHESVMEFNKS